MIAVRAPHIDRTGPIAIAGLLLLGAAIEVGLGDAAARGRIDLLTLFVVAASFALSFAFWRQAVYAALIIVFVEGYFRNLFDEPGVLLLKDLVVLAIYLRVVTDRIQRHDSLLPSNPIGLPLAVFASVVVVQMANPHVTSFQQSLVGVRTWLYYVPLFFVAQEMIRDEKDLRRVAWFMLIAAVPIGLVGFYQYLAGANAYANLGPGFANATFVSGDGASIIFRPNATFAWPSNFALFLSLATLLCTGLLLGSRGGKRWLLWSILAALIIMNVIENQRSLLVLLPPLMLVTVALRRSFGTATLASLAILLAVVVVALIASPGTFMRVDGLIRNQDGIFHARTMTYAEHLRLALRSPIGLGTGATAIGTRYVTGDIPLFVEFSLAKVAGDLSAVGLAVYLWLLAALLRTTFVAHKVAARSGQLAVAGLCAAIFSVQLLVAYAGYDLAVVALPFWFLSGAVVRFTGDPKLSPLRAQGGRTS
ncbi:MAG: hypothetical protein HY873_01540 [Chloroflexi bacterium]|nr:hypothetical protein [Chloroflexota bacterium]